MLIYAYVVEKRVVRFCCMLQNVFLLHCECILQIFKMHRVGNSCALGEHFQKLVFGQQLSTFKYILKTFSFAEDATKFS